MAENSIQLDAILDECLQLIESSGWSVEDCLTHYAAFAAALEPLLHTALRLRQARNTAPSAAFRQQSVARMQVRLQHKQPRRQRWGRLQTRLAGSLAVFVLFIGSAGTVIAASNSAAPGDLLYGIDLTVEEVGLLFAASPDGKTKQRLANSGERLDEVVVLLHDGEQAEAEQAAQKIIVTIAELEGLLVEGHFSPETAISVEQAIVSLHTELVVLGLVEAEEDEDSAPDEPDQATEPDGDGEDDVSGEEPPPAESGTDGADDNNDGGENDADDDNDGEHEGDNSVPHGDDDDGDDGNDCGEEGEEHGEEGNDDGDDDEKHGEEGNDCGEGDEEGDEEDEEGGEEDDSYMSRLIRFCCWLV